MKKYLLNNQLFLAIVFLLLVTLACNQPFARKTAAPEATPNIGVATTAPTNPPVATAAPAPTLDATPVKLPDQVDEKAGRAYYKFPGGYLIVEFLRDDLVHFEISAIFPSPALDHPLGVTPMVAKTDYPGASQFTHENGVLETAGLRVQVYEDFCLRITDISRDTDLVLTKVCPEKMTRYRKRFSLSPEGFTDIYGLGQQFINAGQTDGNWNGMIRYPGNDYGNAMVPFNGGWNGNTQFSVAYFAGQGLDSYALFLDNASSQEWDFRKSPWTISVGGDVIRFYVMSGPDLPDLRQDYMELTGRPPVPPKKAFGLWVSEFGYNNWAELESKLSTLRQNHFPVDGFVLDLQWYGGIEGGSDDTRMGSLRWDTTNFPNPAGKIASLRDNEGVGVILIEQSYVGRNLPEHTTLAQKGYLVRDNCDTCDPIYLTTNPWWGMGGMIDWSNTEGAGWWHDTKREALIQAGIIGHWTDLGEPEIFTLAGWYHGVDIPGESSQKNTHLGIANLYNFLWNQSIYEGYLRNGDEQRPFILSRSGAPGSQRFGVAMWSGDTASNLTTLATAMNSQMMMSFSGMDYYGNDIGGFHRETTDAPLDEMYTLWFANGALLDVPIRPHTENLCDCKETAPDRVGDTASNLFNLRLRYEMSPYLYSLAHRAYLYGEPVYPPLVYYYQADANVRKEGSEKLIGRDLLVASVTEAYANSAMVYLPAGGWYDYYNGKYQESTGADYGPFMLRSGGTFNLPIFAREGAIIPQMYVDDQTMNITGKRLDGSVRDELIVKVFASPDESSFTLYEDDGATIAYQRGEMRTTDVSQQQQGGVIRVIIAAASGTYNGASSSRNNVVKLVYNGGTPLKVLLNDAALPALTTQAAYDAADSGWFSPGENLVLAKSGRLDVSQGKVFEFQLK